MRPCNQTGSPRAVVDAIRAAAGVLLFPDETFDKLRIGLRRAKFDRDISGVDRALYLAQLEGVAEWVSILGSRLGCRDADADMLLETALLGDAQCMVTGDEDLLLMSPFQGIPIMRPAEFRARA